MSNEEAIIILRDTARNNNGTVHRACVMGIEAIKKSEENETPYKPQPYQQYSGVCKCGAVFLDKKTNYCGNCGQKIDWGE